MSEYITEVVYDMFHGTFTRNIREEIVRCRDCVYFKSETDIFPALCRLWLPRNLSKQYGIEPDGFCAWGERRGDAE